VSGARRDAWPWMCVCVLWSSSCCLPGWPRPPAPEDEVRRGVRRAEGSGLAGGGEAPPLRALRNLPAAPLGQARVEWHANTPQEVVETVSDQRLGFQ